MIDATPKRRLEHAGCLLEKFETSSEMIKCEVFQGKSYSLLQVSVHSQIDCIYFKCQKKDVPDKNLSHQTNRHLSK